MELQPDLSGSVQVSPSSNLGWEILNPGNICNCTMTPTGPNGGVTGYVLVYVDNQSLGKNVWFDDVHIEHFTSSVLEENHYYPFGLTVQLDQNTSVQTKQPYKLTGKELEPALGLNWYDFGARPFDMQRGQWVTPDPLAEKMFSWSPYVYNFDNPVKYFDADGREPIRAQAGTAAGFVNFFNNTRTRMGTLRGTDAQDAMRRLGQTEMNWQQGRPTPTTTGPFNLMRDRYIYTENGGWLDMSHFMFYAGKAYGYKEKKEEGQKEMEKHSSGRAGARARNKAAVDPVAEAVQDGYNQETSDQIFAPQSAYSYEDLPTDRLGAEFGANFFDPNSSLTLGEQLNSYLNKLGATNPQNAPNFNDLPENEPEDEPTSTNRTTQPVFINNR